MSAEPYRVRRASLEDLDSLRKLWHSMHLPVVDLERRLTEFQVAEDGLGQVVGTLGFVNLQRNGLVHSEAFADFSLADQLRPLFWPRIQTLVNNHGISRLWTLENAPFWKSHGFQPATEDSLRKLPPAWLDKGDDWLTIQVKDEQAVNSIEKEVSAWMQTEKQRTVEQIEKAKTIKNISLTLVMVIITAILGWAAYLYFNRQHFGMPH